MAFVTAGASGIGAATVRRLAAEGARVAVVDRELTRVLFRTPGPSGFSLVYAWFKSHYPLPAHSHNTLCLYHVIAGELMFGTELLKAGDGFFVPAKAVYSYAAGPQGVEVLEFRDTTEFDCVMRSGSLPMWQRAAAICLANLERWKTEPTPSRDSTGLR